MNNIYHLILVIDQMTSLGAQNKTFITQLDSWRVTGPDGPREILENGFKEGPENNFYKALINYCMEKKNNSAFGKISNTISSTINLITSSPTKLMNGMVAIKDSIVKNVGEISEFIVGSLWGHNNSVYEPRLATEATLKKISGDKFTGLTRDKKLELMLDNLKIMKRNIHYGSEKSDNIKKYIKNYNLINVNEDKIKLDETPEEQIQNLDFEIKSLKIKLDDLTTKDDDIGKIVEEIINKTKKKEDLMSKKGLPIEVDKNKTEETFKNTLKNIGWDKRRIYRADNDFVSSITLMNKDIMLGGADITQEYIIKDSDINEIDKTIELLEKYFEGGSLMPKNIKNRQQGLWLRKQK